MRICFFSLNSYPTLAGTNDARVGGAEVQQKLISQYLASKGHDVSFVTRDYGQEDGEEIGGIKIYKTCPHTAGLPYIRFFHPRLTSIWGALRRADAEVYYQRCAGMETGVAAAFCKRYGRKLIFASASDADFDLDRIITASRRDTWLYVYGLKRADVIVTQTETQRQLLKKNFGLESETVPNCWSSGSSEIKPAADNSRDSVLWVSTLRGWKHPEEVIRLGEKMPDTRFVIVGGDASGERELFDYVKNESSRCGNIDFIGFVPFDQVNEYFNKARVLINTSEPKEGFPNTFLQAWRQGIPVVSYFDPDQIIRRNNLGFVVSSSNEMIAALRKLESPNTYNACSQNALDYFHGNHLIEAVGARYEEIIGGLA